MTHSKPIGDLRFEMTVVPILTILVFRCDGIGEVGA
jgi:hypothetical protein